MVLHFISEDLTQFDVAGGEHKRQFLSSLTASVETVFPFLCQMLQQHFVAAIECQAANRAEEVQAHSRVISSSLSALTTWVEWTPMPRITSSNVIDACTFFLTAVDFRLQALDVLKQIVGRRRATEQQKDYEALMDKVATLLLDQCTKQGLLAPGAQLPAGLSKELDYGGSLEEFGKRLCTTLVGLGDGHFQCLATDERRLQYLQQMLVFTRHPYLLLSSLSLPLWAQLLRDALPHVGGAAGVAPSLVSPMTASAMMQAGAAGDGAPNSPNGRSVKMPSIKIPVECCQMLLGIMVEQMQKVVLASDEGVNDFPPAFDSHLDYKEFCSNYRGMAKQIIRLGTHLAPEQGMTLAAQGLQTALAAVMDGGIALSQRAVRFEAAVHTLEAVLPPLTDLCPQYPPVLEGLAALLQQLMSCGMKEPSLMPFHARALEAFGKFLLLRPDMAAPIVNACFTSMMLIPLEAPGHMPPPAKVTASWRVQFEARLALANTVVTLAKTAPAAFAPYLEALVTEISKLWERGLLREGERVMLWEGLLAASSAATPAIQAQVVQYILSPIHAVWTDPAWLQSMSSPLAFVQRFMPVESNSQGMVTVGARSERWALYHQVTLVERAIRRTTPSSSWALQQQLQQGAGDGAGAPGSAAAVSGGAQAAVDHACNPHLTWFLPAAAQLLRCIHGLGAPGLKDALGPLKLISEMDPMERAIRMGEDRDLVKEKEEPRCVAGATIQDCRYFARGVRECCYMLLSLAGQHCGAMWVNPQLAAAIVPAIMTDLEGLDDGQMRLFLRHVITPWVARCPTPLQPMWIVPLCQALLPHMWLRLNEAWAAVSSTASQQQQQPGQQALKSKEQGDSKAGDEVVTESQLREVTREHMGLLAVVARKPGQEEAGKKHGHANGHGHSGSGAASGSAAEAAPAGSRTDSGGGAAVGESVLELLLQHCPAVAETVLRTAVAGLCWPDAESAAKAMAVCRHVVQLASSVPGLEAFVCKDMLQRAIISLTQVFTLNIQADVLGLLRAIIMTFLSKNNLVEASLQQLLQLSPAVIAEFERQLQQAMSEREQRNLIRQLVAQAGDEEVRKVLSSMGKITPIVLSEPQPKYRHVETEQDQHLSGAIFGMIFQD